MQPILAVWAEIAFMVALALVALQLKTVKEQLLTGVAAAAVADILQPTKPEVVGKVV